ncbi:serine/threonine-protein kinase STY46-like [Aristolochia californica]|uniref:serine/threonine-protein kinase STY46-like n=1 Tax=Aristolochia californica TaxID=171875 RepID=UPI0035D61C8F
MVVFPVLLYQLIDLDKELQLQIELKEQAQDYIRSCLQIAQVNGFLNLFHNQQQSFTSTNIKLKASPEQFPPTALHSDLSATREQAKHNGWYIEPHEIELHEQIGQGTTADIYRGTWRGLDVAVKCIFPQFFHSNQSGTNWFAQELNTLSRQRHPFVLRLLGACMDPPEYGWLVTEFFSENTLKEWLHGNNKRCKERVVPLPPLEERIARGLEIAQAMQYLHEQKPKILHRDLKPSNIFLDDAMHIRVADFGHACFLQDGEWALTGETGTFVYMAPEVLKCEPYNEKCDVYSFAVILNELITGQHPFINYDCGPTKIAIKVATRNLRPTLPENDGQFEELIDLIQQSWNNDASARPSFVIITKTLKRIQDRISKKVEL